jgi:hypothetical protein
VHASGAPTLEEGLELADVVSFVRALLDELSARGAPIRLSFS